MQSRRQGHGWAKFGLGLLSLLGAAGCEVEPTPAGAAPGTTAGPAVGPGVGATAGPGTMLPPGGDAAVPAPAEGDHFVCRYTNPFSNEAECRTYEGTAWDETRSAANCAVPYTGAVGELSRLVCDPTGSIGTCSENVPDDAERVVTTVYGGPLDITESACTGFAGGIWVGTGEEGTISEPGVLGQLALDALVSDDEVTVSPECLDDTCIAPIVEAVGAITMAPTGVTPTVGFAFYPGAAVDVRAYAPALRELARAGFFIAMIPMPGDLAFNGIDRADTIIAANPDITSWFVGGHSLGGAMTARYLQTADLTKIVGAILWAAYPDAADPLNDKGIEVTSIYATNDGASMPDEIEASIPLLPADARVIEIVGGNHGQYADFGPLEGDGAAAISFARQTQILSAATIHFMRSVVEGRQAEHSGFADAVLASATQCHTAQRVLSNVNASMLADDAILDRPSLDVRTFGETKPRTRPGSEKAVVTEHFLLPAGNHIALNAPEAYIREVSCKTKSQAALVQDLGLSADGDAGSCADVNAASLELALSKLSVDELEAYNTSGKSVTFAADEEFGTGVEWLTMGVVALTESDTGLEVRSPSLKVAVDDDRVGVESRGVHYCTLWTPSAALTYVLGVIAD